MVNGQASIGSLKRLGFNSLADCLLAVPKEYRDYTSPARVFGFSADEKPRCYAVMPVNYCMFTEDKLPTRSWKEAYRLEWTVRDAAGDEAAIVIFGNLWPWRKVTPGRELTIWGKLTFFRNSPQFTCPEMVLRAELGTVVPVYVGKVGQVAAEKVQAGVQLAKNHVEEAAVGMVARCGLREAQFSQLTGFNAESLIRSLHWPETADEGHLACKAARRASTYALARTAISYKTIQPTAKSSVALRGDIVAGLIARLPFELTGDQKRAIDMIVKGLREPFPLRDLISGDVGTGKSIVFMVPAVAAYMAGANVAIMAPTQLLVDQLSNEIREYFPEIPVCTITSGGRVSQGVIVGTVAILGAVTKAKIALDLIITDEQQKFSTEQRSRLLHPHTNLIEATATPIPRSIALVMYGGYRLIQIKECPVVKTIRTHVVMSKSLPKLRAFLQDRVGQGKQFAIIYPAVEGDGSDTQNQKNVTDAAARWEAAFPGKVGVLHGKMTDEEKADVIAKMKSRHFDLVVASTVIEVGITLPDLVAIGIVNADHFGLAQLHQLRGRVARKGGPGYCFLLPSKEITEDGLERLAVMEQCDNGFELAERDMELRGFGDLESDTNSQSGKTSTLFWNAGILAGEIEAMADKLTRKLENRMDGMLQV